MSINLVTSDQTEQEPLAASSLLRAWTRAQERLALIKSQEGWRRGCRNAAARRREFDLLRPLDPETDGVIPTPRGGATS